MASSSLPAHARSLIAAVIGIVLVLSGCNSADKDASDSEHDASGSVTVDTAYGEITVAQKPERIIALGGRYLELLDLLGEQPIAFSDYGASTEEMLESYPWMEGTLEGEPDSNLFSEAYQPNAEAIAAYEPDLILTTIWQTDDVLYEQLSKIAPTYVGIEPDTNTSWQDDLSTLAELTHHDTQIVSDTEAELAQALSTAADKLPGLQGKSFYVAALGDGQQLWLTEYAFDLLIELGLSPAEGQPTDGSQAADAPKFTQETMDELTADVVLIAAKNRDPGGQFQAALEADPRTPGLPAAQNGTLIFLEVGEWNAINGGSAASEIWWLDQMLPILETSPLNQTA